MDSRDISIIAQVCVKAATEYATAREGMTISDVVQVAEYLESWIHQAPVRHVPDEAPKEAQVYRPAQNTPPCKKCGGPTKVNENKATNANAPDWKCLDPNCKEGKYRTGTWQADLQKTPDTSNETPPF